MHIHEWHSIYSVSRFRKKKKKRSTYRPSWFSGQKGKQTFYFYVLEEVEWDYIHKTNFTCTIETQLRSFYFKLFHRAICTNQFLHKIGRADNPNCYFCSNLPESLCTFFVNVIKFLPSGMSYVSWLIISLGKHSIFLILIKCLALLISLSMTIV